MQDPGILMIRLIPPSQFKLPRVANAAVKTEKIDNGICCDFGKKHLGLLKFMV